MSQSTLGKFLLGGIRFRKNFIGYETMQTATYGIIECGVKIVPIPLIFAYSYGKGKPTFI